jgi:hypothetical protein
MDCPKELTGQDRKTWKRLFTNLQPKNVVEVEMAKRYVVWFNVFTTEQAELATSGTVTVHGGKGYETQSQSIHFKNMVEAETQMRRLWDKLADSMTEPQDNADLGEFKDL